MVGGVDQTPAARLTFQLEMAETLKTRFPGHFRPSDEALSALSTNATLVPDASALLDLYRTTPSAREVLKDSLQHFHGRIFVPHQFALEFARNRMAAVAEHARAYVHALESLDQLFRGAERDGAHPFVSSESLAHLKAARNELQGALDDQRALMKHDAIAEWVVAFIGDAIGEAPTQEDLAEIYERAKQRFERREPPGFMDAHKGPPDCYGDYVGWTQIIKWAKARKSPVILVTSDAKDDWWSECKGYTLGPQPALVEEFSRETGEAFYAYKTWQFVKWFGPKDEKGVADASTELEKLEQSTAEAARQDAKKKLVDPSRSDGTKKKDKVGAQGDD